MIAIIDIGNSQAKWFVIDNVDAIITAFATASNISDTQLGEHLKALKVKSLVVVSVVPNLSERIVKIAEQINCFEEIVEIDYYGFSKLFKIDIDVSELKPGADRLANACELIRIGKFPACVIDAGSAVTLEVIDVEGSFIGGSISPGESLQLMALQRGTAELYKVKNFPKEVPAIGKSSAAAIASGIRTNVCWGVLGQIIAAQKELAQPFEKIVVTGGAGEIICDFLRQQGLEACFDSKHTIKGILTAYNLIKRVKK